MFIFIIAYELDEKTKKKTGRNRVKRVQTSNERKSNSI